MTHPTSSTPPLPKQAAAATPKTWTTPGRAGRQLRDVLLASAATLALLVAGTVGAHLT